MPAFPSSVHHGTIVVAVLTGIALVISQAWGAVIQKSTNFLVNKMRCGKYLIFNDLEGHGICKNQDTITSALINAVLTTLILYTIIKILF